MVRDFRFDPDPAGIKKISEEGAAVNRALDLAADDAAAGMKRLAGGLDRDDFFGFRDSIKTIPAKDGVAYVGSDSPGWHLQEFGTRHTRPRAVLRRALRAVRGLNFKEGPG
jgi:hypothetical protein